MGLMILPILEALGRSLRLLHIPGAAAYMQHLVLWMAFMGGLLATRDRKHLQLSTSEALPAGRANELIRLLAMSIAASTTALLAWSSVAVVRVNREQGDIFPIGLPEWISESIMPLALGLIALRFTWQASERWPGRLLALMLLPLGFLFDLAPEMVEAYLWPLISVVLLAALLGAPVFVAMAGIAMLLFFEEGTPISAVSAEVYRLIASPTMPAIPLLTGTGYILAESQAAQRLVRFFRALFGWMPGGIAILVAGVCALFTTFTGGSGITIIALGGLVYGILQHDKYPEGFSLGLICAGGSLGLLFPPSLPVLLYSVVAEVPADRLYLAGLLPGMLLVLLVVIYGVFVGRRVEKQRPNYKRPSFDLKELLMASWIAKWELSIPLVVIFLFASGLASIVEASAAALFYSMIIEVLIIKDIHLFRDLPLVLAKAGALIGAVLILLAAAMGLSGYMVDAFIPDELLEWVSQSIESPWIFLLALNGILLVLGSVLEIYSAIVILPPILAPIAVHYGIDPVHMGVIFLANLELGFLFPPVGLNLFLASTRFNKPMVQLYRHVVPYLLILGIGVLIITYLPALSLSIPEWLDPGGNQVVEMQVELPEELD